MATGASGAREKPQPRKTPDQLQTDTPPLEEQIRARAYQIWLDRGGEGGSAEADWLQAKEETLNEAKK